MPAPASDRSRLVHDPESVVAAWAFARRWLIPLFRWAWDFAVRDPERVPVGGAIVVANHVSGVDPFLLAYAMPRPGAIMGKEEVFRLPGIGWALRRFGGFPVRRGAHDEGAIATATAIIAAGWPLILYPEGTRNRSGRWGAKRLRSGAARIALATRAPIVPAAMVGTQAIQPQGAWRPRCVPVEARFGPPLLAETYMPPEDWPLDQQLAHISAAILQAVGDLLPDDLKALPPTPPT
jgi:1-acyl-sn-glycerol-3-phosphate acyltransferase